MVFAVDHCSVSIDRVRVANCDVAPSLRCDGVADLALSLMLSVARRGDGMDLCGKTLGIVGFGRDVQDLARRARAELGMRVVIAADPTTLLPLCDVVAITHAETKIMSGPQLDLMKPGALLIDATECGAVDEAALAQALIFETIGGAALAISAHRPSLNPMLAHCENLVTEPHPGEAQIAAPNLPSQDNVRRIRVA